MSNSSTANKSNTVFIYPVKCFDYDGYVNDKCNYVLSYRAGFGFFTRILREICFRLPFLPKKIWYNKEVLKYKVQYFIVTDVLITGHYLKWLHLHFPNAQINYNYSNMVGKSRHILPENLPEYVRGWTYDSYDSRKYNLRLRKNVNYFEYFVKPKKQIKYDLLFVGADKGRGEFLLNLEQKLCNLGLKVYFHITADGRFSKRKKYYQKSVSYSQITEWIAESKAILNVGMEHQEGYTVRDFESIFNNVKLVTTNKNIINAPFYQKENFFVLGTRPLNEIVAFLNSPYRVFRGA